MPNFFESPLIPQQPNPEPPGYNLLRDMLMRRAFQLNSNPYGFNPSFQGNFQFNPPGGRGLFNPVTGGYGGGGMGMGMPGMGGPGMGMGGPPGMGMPGNLQAILNALGPSTGSAQPMQGGMPMGQPQAQPQQGGASRPAPRAVAPRGGQDAEPVGYAGNPYETPGTQAYGPPPGQGAGGSAPGAWAPPLAPRSAPQPGPTGPPAWGGAYGPGSIGMPGQPARMGGPGLGPGVPERSRQPQMGMAPGGLTPARGRVAPGGAPPPGPPGQHPGVQMPGGPIGPPQRPPGPPPMQPMAGFDGEQSSGEESHISPTVLLSLLGDMVRGLMPGSMGTGEEMDPHIAHLRAMRGLGPTPAHWSDVPEPGKTEEELMSAHDGSIMPRPFAHAGYAGAPFALRSMLPLNRFQGPRSYVPRRLSLGLAPGPR